MTPALSQDSGKISQKLVSEGIKHLYHWTCIENIPSISQAQSLCSKDILEKRGLFPPPKAGGNNLSHGLDKYHNNWDKVCLNFSPYTPMVYHRKRSDHLCFVFIKPEVATWDGVVFTNTNATSNGHQRAAGVGGLSLINFNAVKMVPRPGDREGWFIPVQAEVLVPGEIPLDHVEQIGFVSAASMKEAERLWGDTSPHPEFVVSPSIFTDGPQYGTSVGFAFINDVLLTDQEITSDNVQQKIIRKHAFTRAQHAKITVVSNVHALVGSEIKIFIDDQGLLFSERFSTRDEYYFWSDFNMSTLPNGQHYLEIFLGNIRWVRISFTIT
jgi:ssDNA thymidine ADP-ribosyltransferase DarT-like protein